MIYRFIKFLIVGGVATICQYAILVVLVELASVNAVLSSTLGFGVGAIVSYILNYRYTFTSDSPHAVAIPRFAITAGTGLIINLAVMAALVELLGVYYVISQVAATVVTLLWNFLVNNFWSFRKRDETRRKPHVD